MAIIEVRNITKVYGIDGVQTTALRGVNLNIEKGEFTAIAGPSGSGKTTLLNIIGALDAPTTGEVMLDGQDITHMSAAAQSDLRLYNLGFIFQSYNLIPVLTAVENVEFVMLLQGVPKDERRNKALTILKEVGLGGMENKRPNEMSGGQQQRVAVARAIVSGPKLILADEPTANLDSTTGHGLLDMMHKLNQEKGVTFLFSTHDPMVMDHSRRLIQLHDGLITSDETK